MIDRLITFAMTQRMAIAGLIVALVAIGIWSYITLPVDSFPDVSNVQVMVITEPESMATEEIEAQVTYPIETALNGVPYVTKIRSNSSFGLSVVTAIFEEGTDIYFARQLVQQRLSQVNLPPECPRPVLGPVISSFSNVYMYSLKSDKLDTVELRTLQDWVVSRQLRSVSGVANIITFGGFVKQYQVFVNPGVLRSYGLTLKDIMEAIGSNNLNAGGNLLEQAGEEIVIRGLGRIETTEDIENIVLKSVGGTPVKVGQVAEVNIGPAFRRGAGSMNGEGEAVIGVVQTRKGVNSKVVLEKVKEKLQAIQKELPGGVKIVEIYDQTMLVDKSIETVQEILLMSGALVIIVLSAILLHLPSALIVSVIIPLAMLFSFMMMKFTHLSANLMTLGAVDFGVIVDAGVVMVENIFRHLSEAQKKGRADNWSVILLAAKEVGRPIVFAIAIIVAVYIPLFTLEGIEGKMFHPLALTFIYAISGALLLSLTVIPVMCFWFMKGKIVEKHNPVLEGVHKFYDPLLKRALQNPKRIILVSVAALAASLCLLPFLGSEFIPSLDEGSILLRLKMPPSVALTESCRVFSAVESMIKRFPEVTVVASKVGRGGPGSDPAAGVDSDDMYIGLKPRSEWKTAQSKEDLVNAMARVVTQVPGLLYSFSQPISDMIDDLVAGIRADLGIKIFGEDVKEMNRVAEEIEEAIKAIPGAADIQREQMLGLPQLNIRLKRNEIARYGLNVLDVQEIISTAVGGNQITEVIEGTRRFGLLLRLPKSFRDSVEDIENIIVDTPTGAKVRLKQLAEIRLERGVVFLNREDGSRRVAVLANVRGRDLGSFVADAQKAVASKVKIPRDIRIVWGGQFENQERASQRLMLVLPVVFLLIFVLLFASFSSFKNAALVMLNVPFAMIGGFVALFLTQQTLSVPALIGFIALFGVAVQNGVIMVSYIMQLQKRGYPVVDAIVEGAAVRLRPVLMTALVAIVGLLPKMFSQGTGAEVQRPLATVVLGGLVSSTLLTLIVLPAVYMLLNRGNALEEEKSVVA